MPGCVLRYCTNNSSNTAKCKGITFHRFPLLGRMNREKWIKFVQNNRSEDTWLPSNHTYVCSLHFREEDKYTTKEGRRFLKKSAVPCAVPCLDPRMCHTSTGTMESNSESVSESESIFDTPRKIILKRKIRDISIVKRKLTDKIKKVQRQNRNLKKKCKSLTLLVKSLKTTFSLDRIAENNLLAKAELIEVHKRLMDQKPNLRSSFKYLKLSSFVSSHPNNSAALKLTEQPSKVRFVTVTPTFSHFSSNICFDGKSF